MNAFSIPELHIGRLTARIPIVQGGMGVGVSLSGLASAVAEAGGIGVIAAAGIGMLEPDFDTRFQEANERALQREISRARSMTSGLIGVNIMIALSDHESLLHTALDSGADVIFMGAGLPLKIPAMVTPERIQSGDAMIVPIVSSGRAVEIICRSWLRSGCLPYAFVLEGPLAGGHLGFRKNQIDDPAFSLERLLAETLDALETFRQRAGRDIPVIAGGGVYTGHDVYHLMERGTAGVQMATRFVTTKECDAHDRFREAYLRAREEDLMIIDSPVGLPGRALRNPFLNDVTAGERKPFRCPWKCLRTCNFREAPYCIGMALANAKQGLLEEGFVFAGSNAWRADRIVSVQELMNELVGEYEKVMQENSVA
ncbi:MAG TPA: nitronate monooxygenase [bacterium]|nr:nitronate monooxygenase [bacterium]